ncbi:hypothetical protein SALBM217S_09611 [Streptomyces griseoloalbus]
MRPPDRVPSAPTRAALRHDCPRGSALSGARGTARPATNHPHPASIGTRHGVARKARLPARRHRPQGRRRRTPPLPRPSGPAGRGPSPGRPHPSPSPPPRPSPSPPCPAAPPPARAPAPPPPPQARNPPPPAPPRPPASYAAAEGPAPPADAPRWSRRRRGPGSPGPGGGGRTRTQPGVAASGWHLVDRRGVRRRPQHALQLPGRGGAEHDARAGVLPYRRGQGVDAVELFRDHHGDVRRAPVPQRGLEEGLRIGAAVRRRQVGEDARPVEEQPQGTPGVLGRRVARLVRLAGRGQPTLGLGGGPLQTGHRARQGAPTASTPSGRRHRPDVRPHGAARALRADLSDSAPTSDDTENGGGGAGPPKYGRGRCDRRVIMTT